MLTSFAAIPANDHSSPSSPDANASPSGTNPPAEENPMLIDPQIMMNDQVIKVTIPMMPFLTLQDSLNTSPWQIPLYCCSPMIRT
jgi:hypothetical protein